MANYYYLIASLPDINLDDIDIKFDIDDILQSIEANLSSEDLAFYHELLYINDIKNLVKAIATAHHHPVPHQYFAALSSIGEDIIVNYKKDTDGLPKFISDILEEKEERFDDLSISKIENMFLQSYFEKLQVSDCIFIKKFAKFNISLLNIITALNCRKQDLKIEDSILDDEETSKNLIKNTGKDFGLSDQFEYINQLEEYIDSGSVWELESYVDKLRWRFCEEVTSPLFFQVDNILAYIVKLSIIRRRTTQDIEKARERLQMLTNQALETLEIPQG